MGTRGTGGRAAREVEAEAAAEAEAVATEEVPEDVVTAEEDDLLVEVEAWEDAWEEAGLGA